MLKVKMKYEAISTYSNMFSRISCIAFVVTMVLAQSTQADWTNTVSPTQDNGLVQSNLQSGTLGYNAAGSAVQWPPLAPSDVAAQSYYNFDLWSNATTNQLGEMFALRQELMYFRRFMVLLGGMFLGFRFMEQLFRYH
jgi:hypothetical protein